jgi:acyl-CoA thioesterase FadM
LSDTNARGCVDDTRLLVFFEEARADAIRAAGMPYSEFLARGVRALTVEAIAGPGCARCNAAGAQ